MAALLGGLRRVGERYARWSTSAPYTAAGATAAGVNFTADITCQSFFQHDANNGVDWSRTAGITTFAGFWYGLPAKHLYLLYDRFIGAAPSMRLAAQKVAVDVYGHNPFLLLPTFFLVTGAFKGLTVEDSVAQLKREWFEATIGSAAFWTPLCFLNFRFVPQHSRILSVAVLSFVHKTWLSYLSNRSRYQERLTQTAVPVVARASAVL